MLVFQSCYMFETPRDVTVTGRLVSISKANFCYGSKIVVGGRSFVTDTDIQALRVMLFKQVTINYTTNERCGFSYKVKTVKLYE